MLPHFGPQMESLLSLADPVFAITHSGADAYAWQSKVAGKLHQMTGVRISQSQYQVN